MLAPGCRDWRAGLSSRPGKQEHGISPSCHLAEAAGAAGQGRRVQRGQACPAQPLPQGSQATHPPRPRTRSPPCFSPKCRAEATEGWQTSSAACQTATANGEGNPVPHLPKHPPTCRLLTSGSPPGLAAPHKTPAPSPSPSAGSRAHPQPPLLPLPLMSTR